jgi:hypothetical protein
VVARDVLYVQGDGVSPFQVALEDRSWVGAMLAGNIFDTVTAGIGARGRAHGILAADALAVTTTGASNKGSVVAPGMASVRGTFTGQNGCYIVGNDANVTLTHADRHATLNRRDLIVAQVRDATYSGASNDWQLAIVQGANAASAVDPTVPASSLVLARVVIPGGANPFSTSTMITDLRPHARAMGGITPVQTIADYPAPQDFDCAWEISTSTLKMRGGGAWFTIGRDLDVNWTSVTPNWNSTVTLGAGGSQYLRYIALGKTITGVAGFTLGTGGALTGGLVLDLIDSGLPAPNPLGVTGARYLAGGRMFDASGVNFWSVAADINASNGLIENFATQGNAVWGPTAPVTWAVNDQLRVFFNYDAD